jgi:stage II sporulation protein D
VKGRLAIAAVLFAAGCATSQTPPPATRDSSTIPLPQPTPPQPPMPSVALPADDTEQPLVRVLLDRTSDTVVFPQPGRVYRAIWDGGADWLWGPLRIEVVGHRLWQVGAFGNADAARDVEKRLALDLGEHVEVRGISGTDGLVRVQVRWQTEPPDDPASLLAASGFPAAFVVAAGGRVVIEGQVGRVESDSGVMLEPQGNWPTAYAGRRYRGRFRARGAGSDLLLINELNMEKYLMGVVPVEMGPSVFPELEALKAQAVAARTYAVAHLGDHDEEGYDICATPACQAYYGAGAEHQLSDRAVEETAGMVAVFDGVPIDAMYTSTCAGHTEDAALLFPDRAQPYLTGVACSWERSLHLEGDRTDGPWQDRLAFHATLARQILVLPSEAGAGEIVRAVYDHTGGTAHPPAAVDPESFSTALLAAAGLHAPQDFVRETSGLEILLSLTDLFDLELPPTDEIGGDWPAAAALAVLRLQGEVVRDVGEAVPHPEGAAIYPRRAEASEPLPSPLPLWERWGDAFRRIHEAEVHPGAEIERFRIGDRVVALVVRRSGGADEADRRSAWRSWIRDRSWDDLARQLEIPDLEQLSITRRGSSGRVVELVAEGRSGTLARLEGFPIRRALGLPENLFTFHVFEAPDGTRTVRFLGRGWGHGVGLCQNGSYGLARAGRGFAEILSTYYTGVSLESWP